MKILNRHKRLLHSDATLSLGVSLLFNQRRINRLILSCMASELGCSRFPTLNFIADTILDQRNRFDVSKVNGINGFSLEESTAKQLEHKIIFNKTNHSLSYLKKEINKEEFELLPFMLRHSNGINSADRLNRKEINSIHSLGMHYKKVYKAIKILHRKSLTFKDYVSEINVFENEFKEISSNQITIDNLSKRLDLPVDYLIEICNNYFLKKYGNTFDLSKQYSIPLSYEFLDVFLDENLIYKLEYKKIIKDYKTILKGDGIKKTNIKIVKKHKNIYNNFLVFNHFKNSISSKKNIKIYFEDMGTNLSSIIEYFHINYLLQINNSISKYKFQTRQANTQTRKSKSGAGISKHSFSLDEAGNIKIVTIKTPLKRTGPKLLLEIINYQNLNKNKFLEQLFSVFGIDESRLNLEISTFNLESFERLSSNSKKKANYQSFDIRKKSGGIRNILAPKINLKALQTCTTFFLGHFYFPPTSSHGFVSQKSIITNATEHKNKKFILNIDLKNFFPSITFHKVRYKLIKLGLDNDTALSIANLATLDNTLPQGAPTSPLLSNIICKGLDFKLRSIARKNKCNYSRYADDITFSTNAYKTLKFDSCNLLHETETAIIRHGFKLNDEKTRFQQYSQRQEVTGLVVNEKVNVSREFLRTVRAMLNNWEKAGLRHAQDRFEKIYIKENEHSKSLYRKVNMQSEIIAPVVKVMSSNFSFMYSLAGRIEFIKSVRGLEDKTYIKFDNQYKKLIARDKKLNKKTKVSTSGIIIKGIPFVIPKPQDIRLNTFLYNLRTKKHLKFLTHNNHDEGYNVGNKFAYNSFIKDCNDALSDKGVLNWMRSRNCNSIFNLFKEFVNGPEESHTALPITWVDEGLKSLIMKYGKHPASFDYGKMNLSKNEVDVINKFKASMDLINDSFRVKQNFFIDKINQLNRDKFFNIYYIKDKVGHFSADTLHTNLVNVEKVIGILIFKNLFFEKGSDLFLGYDKIEVDIDEDRIVKYKDKNNEVLELKAKEANAMEKNHPAKKALNKLKQRLKVSIRIYNSNVDRRKNVSDSEIELTPGGDMSQIYGLAEHIFNLSIIANYRNGWHDTCVQQREQNKINIKDIRLTSQIQDNYPEYNVLSNFYQFNLTFSI
jgi:RNA-directed DNA polymerase